MQVIAGRPVKPRPHRARLVGLKTAWLGFWIALVGLRGLPRRVYSASLAGEQGGAWADLAQAGAIGGSPPFQPF